MSTDEQIKKDMYFMQRAIDEAKAAYREGEIPIGAVVVCRDRDLDIVAMDAGALVIVEVKTRKDERFANADAAVTPQKVRSLSLAANAYVKRYNISLEIRFDIITIVGCPDDKHEVRHVKDAFLPFI